MSPPKHIWSGSWRSESEAEAQRRHEMELGSEPVATAEPVTAQTRIAPRPDPTGGAGGTPPPPQVGPPVVQPPPPRRRGPGLLAVVLVALLAGAAGAGGMFALLGGNDDSGTDRATNDPLPAATRSATTPRQGETAANAVFKSASPAVVSIRTDSGTGTGFLIDDQGTIVTNDHVVEEASLAGSSSGQNPVGSRVRVRFGTHGRLLTGVVLGADPSTDLAAVRIDPADMPKNTQPLTLADSDDVEVGDLVIAIGNPFGLDRTLTTGVVSSLGRSIAAPDRYQIDGVIQTDAAINPGNSGGPLLDAGGNVIGVNSQIATASAGNVGIGFAVPSNTVRKVVPALRSGSQPRHAYLGIQSGLPTSGTNGARIVSTIPGGPAAQAGIRAGDIVTAVDGKEIVDPTGLSSAVNSRRPGDRITVSVYRNGDRRQIEVELGLRPQTSTSSTGTP